MGKKSSKKKGQQNSPKIVEQKPAPSAPSLPPPSSSPPSPLTDVESRKKVLRVVVQVLVIVAIMIAMVWGRAYYSQQKFYRQGEKALNEHNYKDAITGYEWAIHMYTPFSGKVKDSCEKLWSIGEEYERRGRLDWALIAYRSLRSSIYAIRSFYMPYKEWIPRTDAKIKMLLEKQKLQEKMESRRQSKGGEKSAK